MNTGTKWGIGLGVGIPAVLILIGLIGIIIKFFMKRFRAKAWDDISSLPKTYPGAENRKTAKRQSTEREPLNPSTTNSTTDLSNRHIVIPMDENDLPPAQREQERAKQHEHTIVQIQRDRLNRLKEEDNRLKPMITLNNGEAGVQNAIDQVQREFEESVAKMNAPIK